MSESNTSFVGDPLTNSVAARAQDCLSAVPLVVLGSGANVEYGIPGMESLRVSILSSLSSDSFAGDDAEQWELFASALSDTDLETAVDRVALGETVLSAVIRETHRVILEADRAFFSTLISDRGILALSGLYVHLFESTHKTIDVVTTNYDRLAEYAADAAGFAWNTGFDYGYLRTRVGQDSLSIYRGVEAVRSVRLWKVHGSVDWFKSPDGAVLAFDVASPPSEFVPLMITPGGQKYQATWQEPFRSILGGADDALVRCRSVICVGYGFNDEHIQVKLVERVREDGIPIVVLAKSLTPAGRSLLLDGRCENFLILEAADDGTRVYSPDSADGEVIDGVELWRLPEFMHFCTGGT